LHRYSPAYALAADNADPGSVEVIKPVLKIGGSTPGEGGGGGTPKSSGVYVVYRFD
jgi:hypothetical protein